MREIHLVDGNGNVLYKTHYSLLENIKEGIIPFQYIVTGSQKFAKFDVVDNQEQNMGTFYVEINGLLDQKICLQYREKILIGYRRKIGDREYVSFYDGETQVGQLTKSGKVNNYLDRYMMHFLDGFEDWKRMLAAFCVYYDAIYHDHTGEYQIGYNEDFIRNHFGKEELDRMERFFYVKPMVGNMTMKTFWIVFATGVGISLLFAGFILAVIFYYTY